MPTYRYYTGDLLTGDPLAELPLYGVFMNKRKSTPGDFTGTFRLDSGRYLDTELMAGTNPGKAAIFCERDGQLIWGGIIWSRTYSSNSKTAQITARTFESLWDHVALEEHTIQQNVEQSVIFEDLIDQVQAQAGNNFGLLKDTPFPTTGIKRTVLVPGYEYHYAQEVVNEVVGVDEGLEYVIDVEPSGTVDQPNKIIRVAYPLLHQNVNTLYYDYPGMIKQYWFPESAAQGGVKFVGLGAGAGINVIRAVVTDGDRVAQGYPSWWRVRSYKHIGTKAQIADRTRRDMTDYRIPVSFPTFEIKPDVGAGFTEWNNVGAPIRVRIEDPRFPDGQVITSRIVGWELQPGDADSLESLKFVIEGED